VLHEIHNFPWRLSLGHLRILLLQHPLHLPSHLPDLLVHPLPHLLSEECTDLLERTTYPPHLLNHAYLSNVDLTEKTSDKRLKKKQEQDGRERKKNTKSS